MKISIFHISKHFLFECVGANLPNLPGVQAYPQFAVKPATPFKNSTRIPAAKTALRNARRYNM